MYKIGEQLFSENGTVNSKIVKINLKIVIGAGGSGVVLKESRGNSFVIKMAKIDPRVMRNWYRSRVGKKLDGSDYSSWSSDYGNTELNAKEWRLFSGI